MAGYKSAVAAGISPVEFWNMTPYLTGKAIKTILDETVTRNWTLAAMMRMKKLPKLDKLLNRGTRKPDLSARLKSALLGFKGKGGVSSPNR